MIGRKPTKSPLVEEFRVCNTPVIGAYVFYHFAKAFYQEAKKKGCPRYPHFLLFAIASAIFSDSRLHEVVCSKRSISTFRRGLAAQKTGVLFDRIHEQVKAVMPYTLAALDIAYACGLMSFDLSTGCVVPVDIRSKPGTKLFISKEIEKDCKVLTVLARWFSECEDYLDVARRLEVVL